MRPVEDISGGVPERLEIRQLGLVRLAEPDDRPAHPGPKTGAFATESV